MRGGGLTTVSTTSLEMYVAFIPVAKHWNTLPLYCTPIPSNMYVMLARLSSEMVISSRLMITDPSTISWRRTSSIVAGEYEHATPKIPSVATTFEEREIEV